MYSAFAMTFSILAVLDCTMVITIDCTAMSLFHLNTGKTCES